MTPSAVYLARWMSDGERWPGHRERDNKKCFWNDLGVYFFTSGMRGPSSDVLAEDVWVGSWQCWCQLGALLSHDHMTSVWFLWKKALKADIGWHHIKVDESSVFQTLLAVKIKTCSACGMEYWLQTKLHRFSCELSGQWTKKPARNSTISVPLGQYHGLLSMASPLAQLHTVCGAIEQSKWCVHSTFFTFLIPFSSPSIGL